MPSERVQRQIDRLLDQAEEAIEQSNWNTVIKRVEAVLRLDPDNKDALAYLQAANRDDFGVALETPSRDRQVVNPISESHGPDNIPTSFANGRYTISRFLGEGGKKQVYLAQDLSLIHL